MKTTIHSYTTFEAAQVLTAEQLNERFNFLDEQIRLTRAKLIGVGILCGLEVSNPDNNSIQVTPGYGITTDGYLICLADASCYPAEAHPECTHFSEFPFPLSHSEYPLFYVNEDDTYQFWELHPTPSPADAFQPDPIPNGFLEDKVVLLFLDCPETDLKNCNPDACENGGIQVDLEIRKLLVSRQDAISIIKNARALDVNWQEDELLEYVSAQTQVSAIYQRKWDVIASNPSSTSDIFEAYYERLTPADVNPLVDALTAFQQYFQPLISNELNPIDGNKIKAIFSAVQTNPSIGIQYYYDFLGDLIAAFMDLQRAALEVLSECNVCNDRFPRHLMLQAALVDEQVEPSPFRHYFIPSLAQERLNLGLKRFQSLYQRLSLLIKGFNPDLFEVKKSANVEEVRITPSCYGKVPLAEKAIPFYYQNSENDPLYQYWNFYKRKTGLSRHNLSYGADQYANLPAILRPLEYDTENYNFFRVEGHLGMPIAGVEARVQELVTTNRLPIKVVSLGTDIDGPNSFNRYIQQHPGIEHKAGVLKGGTLLLVYNGKPTELEGDEEPDPRPPTGPGNVQIIHNSADPLLNDVQITFFAPTIYKSTKVASLKFRDATAFLNLAPGDYTISIAPNNRSGQGVELKFEQLIEPGLSYIITLSGFANPKLENPFGLDVFTTDQALVPSNKTNINLLLHNGYSESPKVQVSINKGVVSDNVEYRSYVGYMELPVKNLQLTFTFDKDRKITYTAPVTTLRGISIVLYLSMIYDIRNLARLGGAALRGVLPSGQILDFTIAGPANEFQDFYYNNPYANWNTGFNSNLNFADNPQGSNVWEALKQPARKATLFGTLSGTQTLDIPEGTVIADFFLPYICCTEEDCDLPCDGEVETCDYEWFFSIKDIQSPKYKESVLELQYIVRIFSWEIDGQELLTNPSTPMYFTLKEVLQDGLLVFADFLNTIGPDSMRFTYVSQGEHGLDTMRVKRPACQEFSLRMTVDQIGGRSAVFVVINQDGITYNDRVSQVSRFFPKTACTTENDCNNTTTCGLPCGGEVIVRNYRWIDNYGYIDKIINSAEGDYDLTFFEFSINGKQLVSSSNPVLVRTTIEDFKANGMQAIASNINAAFPKAPLFGADRGETDQLKIAHFACDTFRFSVISGDEKMDKKKPRYTYEPELVFINGEPVSDSSLRPEVIEEENLCTPSLDIGSQDPYEWLRQRVPKSVQKPYVATAASGIEKEKWINYVNERKPQKFSDLPNKAKDKIRAVKKAIKEKIPGAKVALVGSYAKGTWVDDDTPIEMIGLREKVLGKKASSDIDIIVETDKAFDTKEIKELFDFQIEIFKGKLPKNGILLR